MCCQEILGLVTKVICTLVLQSFTVALNLLQPRSTFCLFDRCRNGEYQPDRVTRENIKCDRG